MASGVRLDHPDSVGGSDLPSWKQQLDHHAAVQRLEPVSISRRQTGIGKPDWTATTT